MTILELIVQKGRVRFSELQSDSGLAKSTLHRLLADLQSEELVRFDERAQLYLPGFRILALASRIWAKSDIRSLSIDQLEWLASSSGESVQLAVRVETQIVCLELVESDHNIRMSQSVGSTSPVYCTAAGKIIMAMLDQYELDALIEQLPFAELTPNTITRPEKLHRELENIRKQNFAEENEEQFKGISGQAVPLINRDGKCIAALSILAPTFRVDDDIRREWTAMLQQAAGNINERLPAIDA